MYSTENNAFFLIYIPLVTRFYVDAPRRYVQQSAWIQMKMNQFESQFHVWPQKTAYQIIFCTCILIQ